MNLDQLRKQAKELKAAVVVGDPTAIERVLASHPKYVGHPPERLATKTFTLRDAQVTLARELGFGGWAELVAESATQRRWVHPTWTPAGHRAWKLAMDRGDTVLAVQHLLLALLDPPEPTVACAVLNGLGLEFDAYRASLPVLKGEYSGISSSPRQQSTEAFALALGLGLGSAVPTDEHVLMALVYENHDATGSTLIHAGLDPDEVYDELARRGVLLPRFRPPPVLSPTGPAGPRVYVPSNEASAVGWALREQHPPGGLHWGMNVSAWKPGYHWYDAEDEIDLPALARAAVSNPSLVTVVPLREAVRAESDARSVGESR